MPEAEWFAEIRKSEFGYGYGYSVHVTNGDMCEYTDSWRLTLRGARRCARRHVRSHDAAPPVIEIVR